MNFDVDYINFLDPPILGLIIYHILGIIFFIKLFRFNKIYTTIYFCWNSVCICFTNQICDFLSLYYDSFHFSRQYFDIKGVFNLFYWTIPFAIECSVVIFFQIFHFVKTLVKIKQAS